MSNPAYRKFELDSGLDRQPRHERRNVRAGHRSSATRIMRNIDALLATPGAEEPKQAQFKLSLEEKLQTLKLVGCRDLGAEW